MATRTITTCDVCELAEEKDRPIRTLALYVRRRSDSNELIVEFVSPSEEARSELCRPCESAIIRGIMEDLVPGLRSC